MVGLGAGEIVGAIVFGKIGDNFSMKVTIAANMFSVVAGFSLLLGYIIRYQYLFDFDIYFLMSWFLPSLSLNWEKR